MSSSLLTKVDSIIREIAAAEIAPRFRRLAQGDIDMKGVNDPVTVADKAAEAALTARLTDAFPGSVVVGEESFAADPAILARMEGEADVWVIDPIDGTRNFISGSDEFAVMVALARRGRAVAAWIHHPLTGDTLAAEQGGGVWLGGKRMRLAGREAGVEPLAVIGSRLRKNIAKPEMAALAARLPPLAAGSASSFDYARLFIGDAVFAGNKAARATYLIYRLTKIWDHLPGLLMLAEAGGHAADFTGQPYDWQHNRGLIIAPDAERWGEFAAVIQPVLESLVVE